MILDMGEPFAEEIVIRIEDTISDAGIADWETIYAKSWKEKE